MKLILLIIALSLVNTPLVMASDSDHYHKHHKRKGKKWKKKFARLDTNGDGQVSEGEWMAKFESMDGDGNKSVSREEMRQFYMKRMKKRMR